jgi:hypothetical protein
MARITQSGEQNATGENGQQVKAALPKRVAQDFDTLRREAQTTASWTSNARSVSRSNWRTTTHAKNDDPLRNRTAGN